jgi:hypothetical protein
MEEMISPALKRGGYAFREQVVIGLRLGVGKHKIDYLIEDRGGGQILVSTKWQQVAGTAEDKVPYEVICLADSVNTSSGKFKKAYLVIGGEGWKSRLKDFYLSSGLNRFLKNCEAVEIISLENFVARANKKAL